MNINFHFLKPITLKKRNALKLFLQQIGKSEKKQFESISFIFCSDQYLLEINRNFLQHDYYTDVITFDLSVNKNAIISEVYISVDRLKENAKTFHSTLNNELHRIIFHSVLHLCGYKDKSKSQVEVMRNKENYYLKHYGL